MERFKYSFAVAVLAAMFFAINAGHLTAQNTAQKTYNSPPEAVEALVSAAKTDDIPQLMQILGPEAKAVVSSGDPVADEAAREKFLKEYAEMHRLGKEPDGSEVLHIGAENWPFPIPLVQKNGAWMFDTAVGKKEILYRRIGRNELETLDTLNALVAAQKEYASEPRDGTQTKQYAQKLLSDEGKHNGLYWKTNEGEETSPIGPLVAEAFNEGYRKQEGPIPFHGYIFRLLKAQGKDAPNGEMNYMTDGKLTRGFAFVAYPVEYRNSGVMTFIVNQDGKIYQKDLGPKTAAIASAMTAYNPDKTWQPSE